jgi:hypothetical protein
VAFSPHHIGGHSVSNAQGLYKYAQNLPFTKSSVTQPHKTRISSKTHFPQHRMSPTPTQLGLLSHLAAVSLLFAALLIRPSKFSHAKLALAFLPPIWACHIYSWSVGLGFLAAVQALQATELLLFQDPREKFQVVYHQKSSPSLALKPTRTSASDSTEGSEKEQIRKEPYPINFWSRLQWVFKLHVSLRYIGWDTNSASTISQPISSFPEETQSRSRWLVQNITLAALCFFFIDATNAYQHLDPYFQVETAIDKPFPLPLAAFLLRYGFGFLPPPRLVRIMVLGVQQYTVFMLINRVLAIVHISLGGLGLLDEWWGGVESWTMFMGSPVVVLSGLRGFWGKFWHQLLRSVSFLQLINLADDDDVRQACTNQGPTAVYEPRKSSCKSS